MRTRPDDLADDDLAGYLADRWGFRPVDIEYVPLGFGSHHWVATDASGQRRFVSADELIPGKRGQLDAALSATARLRDVAGLEFVVAPLHDRDDAVLAELGRFAVAVYPFVEGTRFPAVLQSDSPLRAQRITLLAELHRHTEVAAAAARDPLTIDNRALLEAALDDLDRPWTSGPRSPEVRELIAPHRQALLDGLQAYDAQVAAIHNDPTPWVITHGEPHDGNILVTAHGLRLIDWDTALIAPAARDLWMLARTDEHALDAYAAASGRVVTPVQCEVYQRHWDLSEVGLYCDWLRRPHALTADTQIVWDSLVEHVAADAPWRRPVA